MWTPLVTAEVHTQSFRDNKGRCLNCHGTDHSFKRSPQLLINGSGCFNPHLDQLSDDGEAYRRWQQRMRSHHRHGTRSSSSPDRRSNSSRRNDNNRNRDIHGGNPHGPPRNNPRNDGQGNYNYGGRFCGPPGSLSSRWSHKGYLLQAADHRYPADVVAWLGFEVNLA